MNSYDRSNLEFLLNTDTETLADWYQTVTEDDIVYASELLKTYSEELAVKSILLNDPVVSDLSLTKSLLSRFNN